MRSIAKHKHAGVRRGAKSYTFKTTPRHSDGFCASSTQSAPDLDDVDMIGVGHRVVQGGSRFDSATIIDGHVQDQIEA